MKWLKYALQNIFRNKRRSSVTILIAVIGTMAILISSGFVLFTYDSLREASTRVSGHVVIAHPDYFDKEEEAALELGLSDYQPIADQWSKHEDVKIILPKIEYSGIVSNGDKSTIFMGRGIRPQELQVRGRSISLLDGKVLSLADDIDPQVMLAKDLAKSMNAVVGSYITLLTSTTDGALNAFDFKVQGIFSVGVPEIDKRLLFTHIGSAQELLQTNKVSSVAVHLDSTDKTAAFHQQLTEKLPGFALQPWWQNAPLYHKVKNLYNLIFGLMGLIILVLVFFSVSNTVAMSVVERTREIGTLAALGTRAGQIVRLFVLEAAMMGLIATSLGMLCSILVSYGVVAFDVQMPPPPGRSESYPLNIYISPIFYAWTVGILVLSCSLAAWLAARKGAKQSIVGALSHV